MVNKNIIVLGIFHANSYIFYQRLCRIRGPSFFFTHFPILSHARKIKYKARSPLCCLIPYSVIGEQSKRFHCVGVENLVRVSWIEVGSLWRVFVVVFFYLDESMVDSGHACQQLGYPGIPMCIHCEIMNDQTKERATTHSFCYCCCRNPLQPIFGIWCQVSWCCHQQMHPLL